MGVGASIMDLCGTKTSRDDAASSSSAEGKMLCDGVYSLHEPEGKPEVEIIFIHGQSKQGISTPYEKAYWTTWLARDGSSDNCWPKTWLAEKFPRARILSVSYDVNRALKSPESGTMDIYLVGETLVQEMVFPGVGIGQNGCLVVFVCHDVGGLIAKQIVVMAHEKFQTNTEIRKLSYNIKGFFFYATPHGGSKFVEMVSEIGRLNSRFEHIQREVFHNKWKFKVVAEAHATAYSWNLFGTMIVEEHSVRHVGYDYVIHVRADHFDVCRPESTTSSSFLFLTQFISEVVIVHELETQNKVQRLPNFLASVDDTLSSLSKKLENNSIVGLVGMGGIGKTTLSKLIFNSEMKHYDGSSYLDNVKAHDGNLISFHKQLFRDLCNGEWDDKEDLKYHLRYIQEQIMKKKVLVVIDDIGTRENFKQLQVLCAFKEGQSGSKVIITCREWDILRGFMSDKEIQEVTGLNEDEAMKLFSYYAFEDFNGFHSIGEEERSQFDDQALKIVKACDQLPLSLEVIGQHLRRQNYLSGEKRMEMWKGALKRLKEADAIEGRHDKDERLWAKLKISYDVLNKQLQELFLSFACILSNLEDTNMSTIAWICDSLSDVQTLIDVSLIKVTNNKIVNKKFSKRLFLQFAHSSDSWFSTIKDKLTMHDQLQDLGRRIVRDEAFKNLPKYIWEKNEIQEQLEIKEDSSTLKGLSLIDVNESWALELDEAMEDGRIQIRRFPQMQLLNLSQSASYAVEYIFKTYQMRPKQLKWLCLNGTHLKDFTILFEKGVIMGLRVLQLRRCLYLRTLPPSIAGLTSLTKLDLSSCRNLENLPNEIGNLTELVEVDLSYCMSLVSLPNEIGNLTELVEVDLSHCRSLVSLPTTLGNLKKLKWLNLNACYKLKEIPTSVGQLTKLEYFSLEGCESLHTMCTFEKEMPSLCKLNLRRCENLRSFESLGMLSRLQALDMSGCDRLRIPNMAESLGVMTRLQYLNLEDCGSGAEGAWTPGPGHLGTNARLPELEALWLPDFDPKLDCLPVCPRLQFLHLQCNYYYYLQSDKDEALQESFGNSLGNLTQLQVLHMDGFPTVPESLRNLTQLQELYLCPVMKLPDSLSKLVRLEVLRIKYCYDLVKLPESVCCLSQLRSLQLDGCGKLEYLPQSLLRLTKLSKLDLTYCHAILKLLEEEGDEGHIYGILKRLHSRGCKIKIDYGKYFTISEVEDDEDDENKDQEN
ncbi:hypothetical protein M758_10G137000 [Ceratodon purpureus]|nr:hypothetical protein M758_10G137000 [Ceratodon purpureus]